MHLSGPPINRTKLIHNLKKGLFLPHPEVSFTSRPFTGTRLEATGKDKKDLIHKHPIGQDSISLTTTNPYEGNGLINNKNFTVETEPITFHIVTWTQMKTENYHSLQSNFRLQHSKEEEKEVEK